MAKRGEFTPAVEGALILALVSLGYREKITEHHLRFIPYLFSCAMNSKRLEPIRITAQERKIFRAWRDLGLVSGGASSPVKLSISMWRNLSNVLWMAYVDYPNQEPKE